MIQQEIADGVMSQAVEEIATKVANILSRRLEAKDLLRLLQIVFLNVEETAEILRVKPKTISSWISRGEIPVRYAGGRPLFLLLELLNWMLPENDAHARHRLSVAVSSKIVKNRLATNRERKNPDVD